MVNGHEIAGGEEKPLAPIGADMLLPSGQTLFLALAPLNSPVLLVVSQAAANASGSLSV